MSLTKEQISQFEDFISKIPISKVRSDIERMWDEVKNDGYNFRSRQLDLLKDYSIHLPTELQSFVQSFNHWVKSEDGSVKPEDMPKEKIPEADLGKGVAGTIKKSKVVDKDTTDNSVSEMDDKENTAAKKHTPEKKEEVKELEKEAKQGDLHREIIGMKEHEPAHTPKEKQKVVAVKKSSPKKKK